MVQISEKTEVKLSITAIFAIALFLIATVSAYAISKTNLENKVNHNHTTLSKHLGDYEKKIIEEQEYRRKVGDAIISMSADINHLRNAVDKLEARR